MKPNLKQILEVEIRIRLAGQGIGAFLKSIGFNPSTWSRWKKGIGPTKPNWLKVTVAIYGIETMAELKKNGCIPVMPWKG